ncbi:TlpA family protein disulfide reductase [Novosphingobium mangrovi (ex Huang et al. 2023)]|uniref:Thioredoxin domain-containing protein n=1 Tax=Novosphingobium mangrovi (ex Huang et al. 2023) TaxID=2976432 RepID=A0ABT2I598_9SPHN|nr:hypothetical protein [Novosphingobium mangrovi (ex Huang et al. 2023)]MCT2399992.1 hypothetical protein [Novosphingobium mangrovi (ex Huang et al. 2023)]
MPLRIGAESGDDRRTVILFGASWCAPCIAELRGIGALASAAPSDRILIAWEDTGIDRFRFDRPGNVEVLPIRRAQELRKAHADGIVGYPYAVMLDPHGQVCAHWARMLTSEAMATMKRACARPQS